MSSHRTNKGSVSTMHPRIGASFALIPITIGIELLVYYFAAKLASKASDFMLLGVAIASAPPIIFVGGSLLIWAPVVMWTRKKIARTIYILIAFCGIMVGAGFAASFSDEADVVITLLSVGLIGGGAVIGCLNWIWWTPAHLRGIDPRVPCPTCGYDLRAQRDCRCPECGSEFTAGTLVSATRNEVSPSELECK